MMSQATDDAVDELTKANLLAELMQRVGFALWQLQELETTTATYVVLRLREARGIGRERARELVKDAEKQTFGTLLRELKHKGVLSKAAADKLFTALENRNWLVHRSRRESRGILNKPQLYMGLVERLEQIAADALALNKELAAQVKAHVLQAGISEKVLEQEADRLAKAWGIRV